MFNSSKTDNNVVNGSWEKSDGFVNIYLPSKTDAGRSKMSVMKLKLSKNIEAEVINLYKEKGHEIANEILRHNLIFDFQLASNGQNQGLDLKALPEKAQETTLISPSS
jgi:hypothetical protein